MSYDYLPFGEGLDEQHNGRSTKYSIGARPEANDGQSLKFTSKERDAETALDFFEARYMSAAQGRFTGADEPLADQDQGDPQSWNLYGYVRNNPLIFNDPTGQDCVYTSNQTDSSVTVALEQGNCSQKGGTFVNGTVDANSFKYNGSSVDFGYTDPNGGTGVHSLALPEPQTPGMLALRAAGNQAGRDLSTSAIIMGGSAATAFGAAYAAPAVVGAVSAYRAGQVAAALRAAQEAWQRIPMEQRRAAMDWLSKIKRGSTPGPLPPGVNMEALKAYRDVAVKAMEAGRDGVETQAARVQAIDKVLGK